ncbi:MAG: hypothetical protein F4139_02370 [Gemmatimonadetes bacterium]|nr:hypothetical protein [Gemmatimonadota bacterium]
MSDTRRTPNVAEVPPAGPLCLTGRIKVEVGGEIVADTDDVALCRCGHSSNKPYCDGSHRKVGFDDPGVIQGGRLVPVRDADGDEAADKPVTIVCATDGPLLVRGPLKVVASDGGTSEGVKGALCRCGVSSTKPFCDGSHRETGFVARAIVIIAAGVAASCATPATPPPEEVLTYRVNPEPASYQIADTMVLDINSPLGAFEILAGATVTMGLTFAEDPGGVRVTGTVERFAGSVTNPMGPTETAGLDDVSGTLDILADRYGIVEVASFPEVSGPLAPMSSFPTLPYLLFPRLEEGATDPGSTWTDSVTTSTEGEVDLTSTTVTSYTLMGDTVVEDRTLVRIDVEANIALELEADQQGTMIGQALEGSANGFVLWDPERRLVVYGQFARDLEGDMTMAGIPPIPVGISGPTVLVLH